MVDAHLEAKAIFDPLKRRLPIRAFTYVRFFPDGKRLFVTDNEPLEKHMSWVLQNTAAPLLPDNTQLISRVGSTDNLLLTSANAINASCRDFYKNFYDTMLTELFSGLQLGCSFSVLQRKKNYYEEFVFFPALNDPSSYAQFFSHQDLLHSAMFLFLDKAHDSLKLMKPFHVSAPAFVDTPVIADLGRKKLIEDTAARRFYIDGDSDTYLTRKEAQCAFLLTQSMSATQIAVKMGISKRTVEDHIENIKLKTSISHKFELIQFLIHNNFNQLSTLTEL